MEHYETKGVVGREVSKILGIQQVTEMGKEHLRGCRQGHHNSQHLAGAGCSRMDPFLVDDCK